MGRNPWRRDENQMRSHADLSPLKSRTHSYMKNIKWVYIFVLARCAPRFVSARNSGSEEEGLIIPDDIGDMWDAQYAAGAR